MIHNNSINIIYNHGKNMIIFLAVMLFALLNTADAQSLDFTRDSSYGISNLNAGFVPDPHVKQILAGGSVNVSRQNIGTGCLGYAAVAPDYSIRWSGGGSNLFIYYIAANFGKDATLIINTPTGAWICNDDAHSDTLNPGLEISNPVSGRYDIWVGTYDNDEIRGELHVSEISLSVP